MVAVCIVAGYIETFVPTHLLVPGAKLGLSNAVALLLVANHDLKGAFAVNFTRILLSSLLFGNAFSLTFALSGGIASLILVCALSRLKGLSAIGLSVAGAVTHNLVQLIVAYFVTGHSVIFYSPLLIVAGIFSGSLIGIVCNIILKKVKTNGIF